MQLCRSNAPRVPLSCELGASTRPRFTPVKVIVSPPRVERPACGAETAVTIGASSRLVTSIVSVVVIGAGGTQGALEFAKQPSAVATITIFVTF